MSLAAATNDLRVSGALCIPAVLYEKYEFGFQKACPPELISSTIDFRDVSAPAAIRVESNAVPGLQYNIQTLSNADRAKRVGVNFNESRYGFGCFQEVRDKMTRIRVVDGVARCSSACTSSGNLGCAVWISLQVSWLSVNGKSMRFTKDDICIIFSEPRILIVCCSSRRFKIYVISAHAPYVGCKDSYSAWWDHFANVVQKYCSAGIPMVVGIDANYQCHSNGSINIGELRIKGTPPPQNHDCFIKCVENLSVRVMNTFPELCSPSHPIDPSTYVATANADKRIRIDYLFCSNGSVCKEQSIQVDYGMDTKEEEDDHIPLKGVFAFVCANGAYCPKRRVAEYD